MILIICQCILQSLIISTSLVCVVQSIIASGGGRMFGKRLRNLRKQKNLTMRELGRIFNLAESTISGYENGNRKPDMSIVEQFADFFETSVDYLLGRDPSTNEAAASYLLHRIVSIPIYEVLYTTPNLEATEESQAYECVGSDILQGRKGFVLKIQDESMIGDHIYPNDRVIVVVQESISTSDIAVISIDQKEATLKRVKFQDDICLLSSSNPLIEPIILPFDRVHVIGKVIEIRHGLESN